MVKELYQVKFTYQDNHAIEQWEKDLQKFVDKKSSLRNLESDDFVFKKPRPARLEVSYFVAHYPTIGGDSIGEVANIALLTVIGPKNCWETYCPIIESVTRMGSVAISIEEKDEIRIKSGKETLLISALDASGKLSTEEIIDILQISDKDIQEKRKEQ